MERVVPSLMVLALIFWVFGGVLMRAVRNPSPGGAVVITSFVYFLGITLLLLRDGSDYTRLVFQICALFLPLFMVGYLGAGRILHLRLEPSIGSTPVAQPSRAIRLATWGAFLALTGIMVWILFWSGMDRLLAALYQFLVVGDTSVSVMDLRLGFATGEERYFAPGYVKQVRDVLLPLCALLVMFTFPRTPRRFYGVIVLVVPTVALLMISSGERGPLILFLIGTTYSAFLSVRMRVNARKTILLPIAFIAVVGLGAFAALSSTFTTRGYEDTSAGAILADRIVTRAPEENVLAAQVWARKAPSPGAGWLSELGSVLPGTQVTLSNLIHEELGGGDKGNSVLGTWVDVFYNFGWVLGAPMAFLIGVVLAIFTHWVNIERCVSPARAICGLWLSITMFMVLSPFGFLLYGPFVLSSILFGLSKGPRIIQRWSRSGNEVRAHA